MPRFKKPDWFEKLEDYDKIRFYLRKWAEGHYRCMLMVGPPGRGKSKLAQIVTNRHASANGTKPAHLIRCHGKPFSTYVEAYQHQGQDLILDDVDGLYADADGQRLVKAFGETEVPRTIPWPTIAADKARVPKEFQFSKSVLIIDNAWGVSSHLEVIEDRSRAFLVEPPAPAIHCYVGEWFNQTSIHDMIYGFVGEHINVLAPIISTRLYGHALDAYNAGEDWQEFLLKRGQIDDQRIEKEMLDFIMIELNPYWKNKPVEDKIEAWMARSGMCRRRWCGR
jgi:hypothetical protein